SRRRARHRVRRPRVSRRDARALGGTRWSRRRARRRASAPACGDRSRTAGRCSPLARSQGRRRRTRAVTGLRAAIVLAACAHPPPPIEPLPVTPPAIDDVAFTPPPVDELALRNGIRVLVVANHRLPLVAVTVLHRAAGSRADGARSGLAALTL